MAYVGPQKVDSTSLSQACPKVTHTHPPCRTGGARWGVTEFLVPGIVTRCKTCPPLPSQVALRRAAVWFMLASGSQDAHIYHESLTVVNNPISNAIRGSRYGAFHQENLCLPISLYVLRFNVKHNLAFFVSPMFGVAPGRPAPAVPTGILPTPAAPTDPASLQDFMIILR